MTASCSGRSVDAADGLWRAHSRTLNNAIQMLRAALRARTGGRRRRAPNAIGAELAQMVWAALDELLASSAGAIWRQSGPAGLAVGEVARNGPSSGWAGRKGRPQRQGLAGPSGPATRASWSVGCSRATFGQIPPSNHWAGGSSEGRHLNEQTAGQKEAHWTGRPQFAVVCLSLSEFATSPHTVCNGRL